MIWKYIMKTFLVTLNFYGTQETYVPGEHKLKI